MTLQSCSRLLWPVCSGRRDKVTMTMCWGINGDDQISGVGVLSFYLVPWFYKTQGSFSTEVSCFDNVSLPPCQWGVLSTEGRSINIIKYCQQIMLWSDKLPDSDCIPWSLQQRRCEPRLRWSHQHAHPGHCTQKNELSKVCIVVYAL